MAEIVTMPKLGFDMAEGTLVRWVIAEGEAVSKGNVLAEIETDKATVEVESSYEGVILRHLVKEGDIVPVNEPIAVVGAPGEEVKLGDLPAAAAPVEAAPAADQAATASAPAEAAAPEVETQVEAGAPDGVKASPLARRMAQEQDIDLRQVTGSGPGGRITKKDVESFQPAKVSAAAAASPAKPAPASAAAALPLMPVQTGAIPEDQVVTVNRLRAAIGRRMTESKQQVPHFYVTHQYDMAPVMALRQEVNALLPEGEKTSVNDFLLKAVALGLREFPNLNATLKGDQIIRRGAVNVGVAVAVEGGLLTVVCRDTDRKSVRQISAEVRSMAARARDGKVRPDDIEGSTFSVSNLGMFDVESFIAILNPPEAAILAVGSAREVPVVKDGQVVPGMRMNATISVDHRVSDGAEAARFLQAMARYVEQPLLLMI
jgi:pyruvate dehydrogenase E2 component (dihydrolipoamide acetyltransferase)